MRKGPGTESCTVAPRGLSGCPHLSHIQLAKLFRPQGCLPQTDDKIWSLKWDSLWRNTVASIASTIIAEGPATTSRHLLVTVPASRHPNVRCHHIQTFAQHHSWHSCALRAAARITFCLHSNATSQFRSCSHVAREQIRAENPVPAVLLSLFFTNCM